MSVVVVDMPLPIIVLFPLSLVRENLEGFRNLFEPVRCLLLVMYILVRMPPQCQLAVGFPNVRLVGGRRYLQNSVITSHHSRDLFIRGSCFLADVDIPLISYSHLVHSLAMRMSP